MKPNRSWIFFALILIVATLYLFDVHHYLNFAFFKNNKDSILLMAHENFISALISFFIFYILLTAISFPAASALSILGGLIFGLGIGTIVVLLAATIGSTFAFLLARNYLSNSIHNRYSKYTKSINEGLKEEGNYYLFALRLNPVIPFFVINVAMGLTPIKVGHFFWISLVGMLPGTILYVNAGAQIANISSPKDLISLNLVLSLILLGLVPLLLKKLFKPKHPPDLS